MRLPGGENNIDIRALGAADLSQASEVLAVGLCDNPLEVRALGPDRSRRVKALTRCSGRSSNSRTSNEPDVSRTAAWWECRSRLLPGHAGLGCCHRPGWDSSWPLSARWPPCE